MRLAHLISIFVYTCCGMLAQQTPPNPVSAPPTSHDGAHDFDPVLGNSTFRLHFMLHPLTSTPDWTDMTGTGACYPVWNGRAQLDTVELDSASGGHIEGLTLRLYDREARQWRLYWANSRIGRLDPPQIGEFRDGHGDFYTTDTINGKTTLIRFDWSRMTSGTPHFEQAFSADGGKSWEVNWITDQIRTSDAPWGQPQPGRPSTQPPGAEIPKQSGARDGQHDFDFDFGTWKMHIRRLVHPLSGSSEWTEMEGTTVTNKIWDGRANLATVEADGASWRCASTILERSSGISASRRVTHRCSASLLLVDSKTAAVSSTTANFFTDAIFWFGSRSGRFPPTRFVLSRHSPLTAVRPGKPTGSTHIHG